MGQQKPAKNKAKRKVRGVYGLAAQTRQDRLNKALGDTGSGAVKRKPMAGATKKQKKK